MAIAPHDLRCRCSSKQAIAALSIDEAIGWLQSVAAVEVADVSFIAVPHYCAVATKRYASSVVSNINDRFQTRCCISSFED
jgi:hypothetical protein